MPWGTDVTLIGESAEQVADAQRELVRIGIDRPAGAAAGEVGSTWSPTRSWPATPWSPSRTSRRSRPNVPTARSHPTVLDVRRDDERADAAIPGSSHIPIHHLLDRLDEVPSGTLWVHCPVATAPPSAPACWRARATTWC